MKSVRLSLLPTGHHLAPILDNLIVLRLLSISEWSEKTINLLVIDV